jgi:protein-disulfide isomerase
MEEEKKEHEAEHHSENSAEHHKKHDLTKKVRENPWMLATFVCGALVLILLISTFAGGITGKVISANEAGKKLVSFYQSVGVENLTLKSVEEVSGIYQVNIEYQGQVIPLYITKDGKNIITSLNPTETNTSDTSDTTPQEIPKSDKPTVELYVFTYCPYGTQMEKAILPVVQLLGDKIDFKIRQIGAMHGDHEKLEAERQLCIEKNYPSKYLSYVSKFVSDSAIGNCNGDAACLTPKLSTIYTSLGIDASKINSCITSEGETMYNAEVSNSQSAGVSGSPTLIINGVTASSERNPEAVKGTICSAFNEVPSACSTTLSTASASAGFGSSTTASSSSSASC